MASAGVDRRGAAASVGRLSPLFYPHPRLRRRASSGSAGRARAHSRGCRQMRCRGRGEGDEADRGESRQADDGQAPRARRPSQAVGTPLEASTRDGWKEWALEGAAFARRQIPAHSCAGGQRGWARGKARAQPAVAQGAARALTCYPPIAMSSHGSTAVGGGNGRRTGPTTATHLVVGRPVTGLSGVAPAPWTRGRVRWPRGMQAGGLRCAKAGQPSGQNLPPRRTSFAPSARLASISFRQLIGRDPLHACRCGACSAGRLSRFQVDHSLPGQWQGPRPTHTTRVPRTRD